MANECLLVFQDFDYSWYDKTGVAFLYNYFMNMVVIWCVHEGRLGHTAFNPTSLSYYVCN